MRWIANFMARASVIFAIVVAYTWWRYHDCGVRWEIGRTDLISYEHGLVIRRSRWLPTHQPDATSLTAFFGFQISYNRFQHEGETGSSCEFRGTYPSML